MAKRAAKQPIREVRLGRRDLDLERARAATKINVVYRFSSDDLIARDDSNFSPMLKADDLENRQQISDEKEKKRRCICLMVIIVAKTPAADGRSGSKYSGGKWKSERDFLDLLTDAMQYLFDCIDEACVHVREIDCSRKKWEKYFAKTPDGKLLEFLDAAKRDDFVETVRADMAKWKDVPCCWLIFNSVVDDGLANTKPGTTPITPKQVPGTKTYRVVSDDYSFVSDKAKGFQIAHEIVHQAGATHGKDNLVPDDGNGEPDVNGTIPGNKRDKTDLMHPTSQEGAKLADDDCKLLREHTKNHKCCDQKAA